MYYRRKILFSILEAFGGKLSRTQMQKLAFIFTRWQEKKAFDFVPYRFGCYSFQLNQDLQALTTRRHLEEQKTNGYTYWYKLDKTSYITQLRQMDRELLARLSKKFQAANPDDLIAYTYIHYPYYAINSTIAEQYLDKDQLERVAQQRRNFDAKKLFTIGYEGISLEHYLNKLIVQDVRLLCDVRKNSYSMKYGFSKSQLSHACKQVGITFLHLPELGIESNKRKELKTLDNYRTLFHEYESSTLQQNHSHLLKLASLLERYPRIAITCFEASHTMCHRGCIANALKALPNWETPIAHL
ncbi:MAG: DUF488 family protein [Lewinellaceae bacterium]|nr:DUF488 family protein [Lewinellaceae bacterium]